MRTRAAALILSLGLALAPGLGCSSLPNPPSWLWPFGQEPTGPAPAEDADLDLVEAQGVFDFYQRASSFYGRLARRRFNNIATYRDEVLRDFFRTDAAYADYYADFAQNLSEAHFERSRPLSLEVVEFRLEAPGEAKVYTRLVGENGLPLRWWKTEIEREDRWERIEGTWWIVPGRL